MYESYPINSDDHSELLFSTNPDGGSCGAHIDLVSMFKTPCCSGTDPNHSKNKISEKVLLEAGRSYPIEHKFGEGGSHAYFNLGVIYHGTASEYNMNAHGDLWQNHQNSGSNCMDEKQRIRLVSHEQRENIAVKVEGDQSAQFSLKWCDDANNCKVSTPMAGSDGHGVYKNTVQDLLNSKARFK